ncbi:aldo/keto reductase [Cohnella zeiphila]|uniref:Aldo/keto reductase n=1 Tax=Cohnella zeiphila TaxID=2761120 RepID=A0A7X0SJ75_9BACL|nr:aldo/keto reductase [Cohnella zeiphila]MBB6730978.1 aldo/keto reductase [Cohnella zeiphila]
MERRDYGNTGMSVSALGFGAAEIGFIGADAKAIERLLGSALDAGLNLIDTGECYGDSEALIGEAVGHRRSEYFLFTKCGHGKVAGYDRPDWEPALLEETIDRSLRRLRTDCLDVVHLHNCSEELLRQGDVIDVLLRAREKGKIRFLGYSGDHFAALYAATCGAFQSLQTSVSIADQEAIELTLPEARKRGIGVVAKRPIANAVWTAPGKVENERHREYAERLGKLDYDFFRERPEEAIGIALRFTLSVPGVHSAIVGTAKPGRWEENAKILANGPLEIEEYEAIRTVWRERAEAGWRGLG